MQISTKTISSKTCEERYTPFSKTSLSSSFFQMLKSCKKLSMTVRSPSLPAVPSSGGAPWQMRQTCSWIDRQGRPVSPPIEYIRSSQMAPPERYGFGRASSKDRSIRRVSAMRRVYLRFWWRRQMWACEFYEI